MKILLITLISLVSLTVVADPQALPPGKYMFSAPAIYSSTNDKAPEWLCEMTKVKERHRLRFLKDGSGSFIDFKVSNGDSLAIDESKVSMGEIGRKVKGKGKLIGNEEARGTISVLSGSPGFLLVKKEKSEWYLRPATEEEITEKMMEGLREVADALYRRNREPTLENIRNELPTGAGFGYSFSDHPKIMGMLREGTLSFTNNQFVLKKKVVTEPLDTSPIFPEVDAEDIPYKSKEELLQIAKSFEEEAESVPIPEPDSVSIVPEEPVPVPLVKPQELPSPKFEQKPSVPKPVLPDEEKSTNTSGVVILVAIIGCVVLFAGIWIIRKKRQ